MTAAGVTAVTVEWRSGCTPHRSAEWCGCRPALLATGEHLVVVHEADPVSPVRCRRLPCDADEHVRAGLQRCTDHAWLGCADVLCWDQPLDGAPALRLARQVLRDHGGCLLAGARLTGGGCLALSRNGRCWLAGGPLLDVAELGWVASLLHGWVALGVQLPTGGPSRLLIRSRSRWVSLGLIEE